MPLWLSRAPLPNHFISAGHTDAPSLRVCLCLEEDWCKELCYLLLWGWGCPRGGCACSTQLCCYIGLSCDILLVRVYACVFLFCGELKPLVPFPHSSSRNNGYAISTPTSENYRGDGIGKKKHSVESIIARMMQQASFPSSSCSVQGTRLWNGVCAH